MISLGVGDPDLPTPPHVVEALKDAAADPATHRYPSYYGLPEFRSVIAGWYRHQVRRRAGPGHRGAPADRVEGGHRTPLVRVAGPGRRGARAGPGLPRVLHQRAAGRSAARADAPGCGPRVPAGSQTRSDRRPRAKVMWLDYPSNPTAAVADVGVFEQAVGFAAEHDLLLCHDAAYSEMTFDGTWPRASSRPPGRRTSPWSSGRCRRRTT